jgi:hypothetical protein
MMVPQQMQMPPMPANLSMANFMPRMFVLFFDLIQKKMFLCSSDEWSTIYGTTEWLSTNGIQWSTLLIMRTMYVGVSFILLLFLSLRKTKQN